MTDGLDHIVNSERGNGGPRQGFHFHTSFMGDSTFALDENLIIFKPNFNVYLVQG